MLSEAGVEVARGGAEGAGERAAHHRETRLALEGLTLLFLPGLREDALAARDNLIHGEKHEETGEAARDGGRRLVLELQDQLLLKALDGRATCVSGHPWHCRPTTGASDGNPTAWAGGRSHKPIFSKRLPARDRARGQV